MKPKLIAAIFLFCCLALSIEAQPGIGLGQSLEKKMAGSWYDGTIQYSVINNCITGSVEYGAGTYVGFFADPNAGQPAPGTTYYVHVVVYGLGNPCSGGTGAYIEIVLPASTSLAITATNKVYYFYDGGAFAANQSPQTLPASTYNPGAIALLSVDNANANTWGVAQGHNIEIQIPVVSTTALSGSILQANVWAIDGNSSPWLHPQEGVFVFSSTPSILYATPSTTAITNTSGHSQVTLYTGGTSGTGYFDLGTTTSYGFIHDPVTIAPGNTSYTVWDDWGPPALTPGTLYHWRFTYTTSGGATYVGADQTFTTTGGTTPVDRALIPNAKNKLQQRVGSFDILGRLFPATKTGIKPEGMIPGIRIQEGINGEPAQRKTQLK